MSTPFVYVLASVGEIAGCFAFWARLRLGKSPLWLLPGMASLALFAYLLTRIDTATARRAYAAYGSVYIVSSICWLWGRRGRAARPLGRHRRERCAGRSGDHRLRCPQPGATHEHRIIVVVLPALDHGRRLGPRPEPLDAQTVVAELPIEALVEAVLPRLARIDAGRLNAGREEPPENRARHELWPIVRPEVPRRHGRSPGDSGPRSRVPIDSTLPHTKLLT
jgi:small multidrug resistance family-3 protein